MRLVRKRFVLNQRTICARIPSREPVHREEESSGNGITFRKRIGSDSTDKRYIFLRLYLE